MRFPLAFFAVLVLPLPASASDVSVRLTDGRVDLSANAAPIADVLDRLSKQTGMKVVYEGPAPRQLVTLSLHGRSPAEAVLGLLEGQGLNYILIGDATGDRVQTLMMAGSAPTTSRPTASGSSGSRTTSPPPASGPDADEPVEEPEEEPEPAQVVQPPNGIPQLPGGPTNPAGATIGGQAPGQNAPPAISIPGLPAFPGAPSSPMQFAPQVPGGVQPFPSLPGVGLPGAQKPPQAGQENQQPPN